jgi:tetratricopeptide (TPR) repeat protein
MALVMSVAGAFGQKANVSKAKSKAQAGEYADARALIKLALADPTTANEAETWYVAGFVGSKENDKLYAMARATLKYDSIAKGKAVMESIPYYLKADELGEIPDAKGKVKNKYRKDIVTDIKNYFVNGDIVNYGAILYDNRDFKGAYDAFMLHLSVPQMPIMQGQEQVFETAKDATKQVQYYAALAASNAKMPAQAIEMYKKSIADDYEKLGCYQLMVNEYQALKDTVGYVQTLKDGFAAFPKEPWFLQNLINHYIFCGQESDAVKYLDDAITNEPTVAEYYYVKGMLEEKLNNIESAEANFNKALEINPDMAGAYAGKGRLLFNKGIQVAESASSITDTKRYNAEIEKAESLYRQGMPLFQKAVQLDDKETEYLENLKQVYYRLNMIDEYNDITKKIKEL